MTLVLCQQTPAATWTGKLHLAAEQHHVYSLYNLQCLIEQRYIVECLCMGDREAAAASKQCRPLRRSTIAGAS